MASLDPVVGSEQGKTRPVVIVAAVTTAISSEEYPTEVLVRAPEGGLRHDSLVLLNQIRTIDKRRLITHWGRLSSPTMDQVDNALKISLGLIAL